VTNEIDTLAAPRSGKSGADYNSDKEVTVAVGDGQQRAVCSDSRELLDSRDVGQVEALRLGDRVHHFG
jgi:hypothetical protein